MKTAKELIDEAKRSIKEVNVDEAQKILQAGKAVFLDVREPQEFIEGILPGAIRIPRGLLELQIEKIQSDRSRPLVVYCAGGVRSALAAKTLAEMGYKDVKSMAGGFVVWEAAGYPIEGAS